MDQFAGHAIAFPPDADHIEARVAVVQRMFAEIVFRGARHLALLATIHSFEGAAESFLRAGLHFDEDDGGAVEGDKVNFASGAAVVPLQDPIAMPAQEFFRRAFALSAQYLAFVRHAANDRAQ